MNDHRKKLYSIISSYKSLAVAFSGGVDSTLLAKVSLDIHGDNLVLMHVASPFTPAPESDFVEKWAKDNNARLVNVELNPLDDPQIRLNCHRRCYYCKRLIMEHIIKEASKIGIVDVADGSNLDDLNDYRPGMEATKELNIKRPLIDAGFTKEMIREMAKEMGLPNWHKPASACLASRIPYGTHLEKEILEKIDSAETFLAADGIQGSRVRVIENSLAKIEVNPSYFSLIVSNHEKIVNYFTGLGFEDILLDLKGYRTGALNEKVLNKKP
ncbi:MAG: TIGR00268 family protein [Lentisphaerae bacterium GWF2_45_14]|nr:MAG: TIGR00268 family protein [Lentisphaerae bacterium GWF2_45_14]